MRHAMPGVIRLEVTIMRLMEMNHNRHDLTGRQLGSATTFERALCEHLLVPIGLKPLAKVIDMAEEFQ